MSRLSRRALCGILIAGGGLAGTAVAADPESGTVSAAAPKVTWKGAYSEGSYFVSRAMILEDGAGQNGQTPCAQGCDTFTLTVADSQDLTISANSPSEDAADPDQVVIRVKKPDDSYLTTVGESSATKPLVVKFKKAPVGEYVIDYSNNYADAGTYDGVAFLGSGTAPTATPTPAPSGGGGGGQQPQPAGPLPGGSAGSGGGQNIDISVKVGKQSARKLKKSRKLTATVTVSREVAKVSAFLRKGSKLVGSGRRGTTAGTAKLTVKLSKKAARKLRKGTYALAVVADDGKGTTATKTVKVKVRK